MVGGFVGEDREQHVVRAEPRASAMIESLRAVGYSLPTAIADLVDNSIAARARNVWVHFGWLGGDSFVSVTDDGVGMAPDGLTEAMRPGTIGPLEARDPGDLGRFGLGLKTASFSHCRRLTVASRVDGAETAVRRWDLDYVRAKDDWLLLTYPAEGSKSRYGQLSDLRSGTVVLWECLDRIVGDQRENNPKARARFYELVRDVDEYLAMVFHRFLDGGQPRIAIHIGVGEEPHRIEPWDPFLVHHAATFSTPEDRIPLLGDEIRVKGFVLPHKSKLSPAEHQLAGGPGGWNSRQGFYVYRNERLVVPGSWLGLGQNRPWTREEHYKLARIRVDVPNSMDMAWHLDVKKSDARPPSEVRERLKDLAMVVRGKAKHVFSHRGAVDPRSEVSEISGDLVGARSRRSSDLPDRSQPLPRA